MKAKTSYHRRRTELIVERLEAERKELDIGIEAGLEAERREVESSIEVAAKVGRMRLYLEVANIAEVARKLDSQNSKVLDL